MKRRLPLLLLVLLLPRTAAAGPYEYFGTGPRAIALGGAYAALGRDAASVYYNPASLTQVQRLHFELGYVYAQPHFTINGDEHDVDFNRGTNIGAVISTVIKGHRISTGLNSFVPDDHVIRFLVLPTDHPHSPFTANANHTVVTVVAVGLEIFRWWSIGGGLSILGDNKGGVKFKINENEASSGSLSSAIGSSFSPTAGLWFRPLEWWQIGLSYREKVEMDLDLPNTIDIPPLQAFDNNNVAILRASRLILEAQSWSHFSPRQFQLGCAFTPLDRLLISTDLMFMEWSEMRSDAPASAVYLSGGLADIFPTQNGQPPPDPNFHDTWNPSLGLEVKTLTGYWLQMDLRGGYRYRPTPVPNQTGISNYLDSNTHVMAAGLGLTFRDPLELLPRPFSLDSYFQFHQHETRRTEKYDPSDQIGDYTFAGYWIHIGANLTLRF